VQLELPVKGRRSADFEKKFARKEKFLDERGACT